MRRTSVFASGKNLGAGRIHSARACAMNWGTPLDGTSGGATRKRCETSGPCSCPPRRLWLSLNWTSKWGYDTSLLAAQPLRPTLQTGHRPVCFTLRWLCSNWTSKLSAFFPKIVAPIPHFLSFRIGRESAVPAGGTVPPPILFSPCRKENGPRPVQEKRAPFLSNRGSISPFDRAFCCFALQA